MYTVLLEVNASLPFSLYAHVSESHEMWDLGHRAALCSPQLHSGVALLPLQESSPSSCSCACFLSLADPVDSMSLLELI